MVTRTPNKKTTNVEQLSKQIDDINHINEQINRLTTEEDLEKQIDKISDIVQENNSLADKK